MSTYLPWTFRFLTILLHVLSSCHLILCLDIFLFVDSHQSHRKLGNDTNKLYVNNDVLGTE
jgi:hypothetical protein